jgi:ABC-2 type transport system ATP-binding protein
MIIAEHLTRHFGSLAAVQDLDLSVRAGELFGFLGPNGAGKSTTLRMLAGILRPTAGRACIAGKDVQAQPLAAKRALGYMPDEPALYEQLTGREFLRFVGGLYGLSDDTVDARAAKLLAMLGLAEKADQVLQSYSHGMRQKIVLCTALLHEPAVLLLDEPLSGLDPHSARRVKDLLRQFCQQGGAVLLSTHTLEIAERLCDRIGILHEGRLIAAGTMDGLRAQAHTSDGATLEDLFLRLTGGAAVADLAQAL